MLAREPDTWALQMESMLDASPEWLWPVTRLVLAGVSPGEAVRLRWRDLDPRRPVLRVIREDHSMREVWIGPAAAELWRRHAREPEDFVVVGEDGTAPLPADQARRSLAHVASRVGALGLPAVRDALGVYASPCAG